MPSKLAKESFEVAVNLYLFALGVVFLRERKTGCPHVRLDAFLAGRGIAPQAEPLHTINPARFDSRF
jgi:hypothetical protein